MIIAGVLSLVIGFSISNIFATVVISGIATTFVCLAEDPEVLKRNDPKLYSEFERVYPTINYGIMK